MEWHFYSKNMKKKIFLNQKLITVSQSKNNCETVQIFQFLKEWNSPDLDHTQLFFDWAPNLRVRFYTT